ncbi:hypothetical protein KIPB_000912 [Kipferlia bialata]|uniref:Uncharacterized protein n=1 Tax=Kipferlia bialata TaxID=797122 RepID=A0A9K3GF59_9EUKA|nr:hypothetical protein KIPB_000912 [Kipferlia bialata]|eukprot:g912.t1
MNVGKRSSDDGGQGRIPENRPPDSATVAAEGGDSPGGYSPSDEGIVSGKVSSPTLSDTCGWDDFPALQGQSLHMRPGGDADVDTVLRTPIFRLCDAAPYTPSPSGGSGPVTTEPLEDNGSDMPVYDEAPTSLLPSAPAPALARDPDSLSLPVEEYPSPASGEVSMAEAEAEAEGAEGTDPVEAEAETEAEAVDVSPETDGPDPESQSPGCEAEAEAETDRAGQVDSQAIAAQAAALSLEDIDQLIAETAPAVCRDGLGLRPLTPTEQGEADTAPGEGEADQGDGPQGSPTKEDTVVSSASPKERERAKPSRSRAAYLRVVREREAAAQREREEEAAAKEARRQRDLRLKEVSALARSKVCSPHGSSLHSGRTDTLEFSPARGVSSHRYSVGLALEQETRRVHSGLTGRGSSKKRRSARTGCPQSERVRSSQTPSQRESERRGRSACLGGSDAPPALPLQTLLQGREGRVPSVQSGSLMGPKGSVARDESPQSALPPLDAVQMLGQPRPVAHPESEGEEETGGVLGTDTEPIQVRESESEAASLPTSDPVPVPVPEAEAEADADAEAEAEEGHGTETLSVGMGGGEGEGDVPNPAPLSLAAEVVSDTDTVVDTDRAKDTTSTALPPDTTSVTVSSSDAMFTPHPQGAPNPTLTLSASAASESVSLASGEGAVPPSLSARVSGLPCAQVMRVGKVNRRGKVQPRCAVVTAYKTEIQLRWDKAPKGRETPSASDLQHCGKVLGVRGDRGDPGKGGSVCVTLYAYSEGETKDITLVVPDEACYVSLTVDIPQCLMAC